MDVLRRKGKSRKPKDTVVNLILVNQFLLDQNILKKDRIWTLGIGYDSFFKRKSKGCFATFAEMKTRFYVAIKMLDRSKDSMYKAIEQLVSSGLPKKVFKSFTSDRGKEFACYKDVEKNLKIDFYFADPYSAWQRGTNENSNGLLREFYPKKTDLALVEDKDLIGSLKTINARPRKCLAFRTPFEDFYTKLII